MSKYDPLGDYLKTSGKTLIRLSFEEIEHILGFRLPMYLYNYEAGWYGTAEGSPTHRQKAVWCEAGYQVKTVQLLRQEVIFEKRTI